MNKFIIFALLFVFVLNEDYKDYFYTGENAEECDDYDSEASVDNCNNITFSDDDYKCCFESYKDDSDDEKDCRAIKKSKAKKLVEAYEDEYGYTDVSIDCSSNYISNALLILLSLLF